MKSTDTKPPKIDAKPSEQLRTLLLALDGKQLSGQELQEAAHEASRLLGHRVRIGPDGPVDRAAGLVRVLPQTELSPIQQEVLQTALTSTATLEPPRSDNELLRENKELRAALRHLMYVVTDPSSMFDRADFVGERFESGFTTGISGLNEAYHLLKRLGEHDSSVADQDDAWLPPKPKS
jgi:hypothetical protein